jgi:hypothetical protein
VFAHAHEPIKFTDDRIVALCAKLELGQNTISRRIAASPSREQFMFAAANISLRLEGYRLIAERPVPGGPLPGGPPEE